MMSFGRSTRPSGEISAVRLAIVQTLVIAPIGLQLPFMPLWFATVGLTAPAIAAIQATTPVARFLSNLVIPSIADRTGRTGILIAVCALGMALAMTALGFARDFWPIYALMILSAFAQGPMPPLADSLVLRETRRRVLTREPALDYGVVRGAGSLSCLALMIIGGWLVGLFPPQATPFLVAAVMGCAIPALIALSPPAEAPARVGDREERAPKIERPLLLALVIATAMIVQASHADIYAFGSIGFRTLGFDNRTIGLLWAVSVVAEIAFFMLIGRRLGGADSAFRFLIAGAGVGVLRWTLMAFATHPLALVGLQLLHAGSFAATHLGAVYAIGRLAGERRRAQGQGWASGANALGIAGVTLACGHLWERFGAYSYLAMAALALVAFVLALWATFLDRSYPQTSDDGGYTSDPS